jgi:hypothetical protein
VEFSVLFYGINLIEIRYLLYVFFFGDTSNNILFRVISCDLSFIFDHPIIKPVKYIDKSVLISNDLGRLKIKTLTERDVVRC